MRSQGDFAPGKTVRIAFNTRDTGGAPITLAGTPAVSVYKDGSLTESTAGVTLSVDFDSRTGLHLVTVDTSADGTFYSAGSDFKVVITTGTVATISVVGVCVGAFSLYNRSPLRPATADRTLVVDAAGLADANMVKMGPTGSGTALTARDIGASVLLSSGAGTGQLDFTSGVVKANLAQILGTALTETAGLIAAAFKKFFNVATPTGTVNSIPDAVAGTANGLAIVGSAMSNDMTQAVPTSNTANTVGDALNAARAQGFGKWAIVGTTLTLYAPDGTTAVRAFTLDSATSPTSRT